MQGGEEDPQSTAHGVHAEGKMRKSSYTFFLLGAGRISNMSCTQHAYNSQTNLTDLNLSAHHLPPRQIGELEQLLSSQVAERERRTEELQTLQDEMDTAREEISFKEHRILALEMAVLKEKEQVASMEGEMQTLMDRYSLEVEKNTRLNSELQEGHSGREVGGISCHYTSPNRCKPVHYN